MTLTLEFLIEALTGQRPDGSTPISEVVIDSRKLTRGGVFFALKGEHSDGHDFAADAFGRGALAVVVEREIDSLHPVIDLQNNGGALAMSTSGETPLRTPAVIRVENTVLALQEVARQWVKRFTVRTVGITGSVGKSTTKELIADVLSRRYKTLRSEGSYNNELGIPLTVLKLNDSIQRMALEMSMYVIGEIDLLTRIAPPHVGVVTLIAPVHLERAGSLEAIIQAKSELVRALPPDGIAVLNRDDENVMKMAAMTPARVVTYGLHPEADFRADQIEGLGLDGIRFWLHHKNQHMQLHLRLLGRHSVHTALAAAAVAYEDRMSWEEIAEGLQTSHRQLRLYAVKGPNGSLALDDTYNASPSSTIAALNLLNDLGDPAGKRDERRIAVLGDMLELGSYEREGHELVGIRAAAVVDVLITVGQRAKIIGQEAINAGLPRDAVRQFETAEEAADFIMRIAAAGDTILIKGSRAVGMERIVAYLTA